MQRFEEVLNLAQHKRFSPSSETYEGDGQVFNEAEQVTETEPEEVVNTDTPTLETTVETPTNAPAKPRRPRITPELPRIEVLHDIDTKTCTCCGNELHRMGEEVSEQIEFIPAEIRVIKHVRPKYSCRTCEREGTEVAIQIADVPDTLFPKSMATPSLVAQIISAKMHYGLPLYRQEKMFSEAGIELSRQTMSRWLISCADKLEPLLALMKTELLKQPALWADETTLDVLDVDKSTCYMWVYGCGVEGSAGAKLVLFDYQDGRSGQHAVQFLDGYNGYLQVDGYAGYEQTSATLAGCWAHARRRLFDALTVDRERAMIGIGFIGLLYDAHYAATDADSGITDAQRRRALAEPILAKLYNWIAAERPKLVDESPIKKALNYLVNQREPLARFLDDGRLRLDNNISEVELRRQIVGRHNWTFAGSDDGAEWNAIATTLIASCHRHSIEPWAYLRDILTLLPSWPKRDVLHLAPKLWNQTRQQPETQQRLAAARLFGRFDEVHALDSTS